MLIISWGKVADASSSHVRNSYSIKLAIFTTPTTPCKNFTQQFWTHVQVYMALKCKLEWEKFYSDWLQYQNLWNIKIPQNIYRCCSIIVYQIYEHVCPHSRMSHSQKSMITHLNDIGMGLIVMIWRGVWWQKFYGSFLFAA